MPKDYPISFHCVLRGSPWVVPGLVVLPTMNKFVFWVTEPFHSLDGNKEKNKGCCWSK